MVRDFYGGCIIVYDNGSLLVSVMLEIYYGLNFSVKIHIIFFIFDIQTFSTSMSDNLLKPRVPTWQWHGVCLQSEFFFWIVYEYPNIQNP